MKIILRTVFPAVLLMTFLSGSALAQTKVATVNLKMLFDGYWKTKQAQAAIQDRAAQLDKDDKSMKADLKKAADEYQQLLEQANDQAISAAERDRRKKDADDKLKQLQGSQTALDQYERQAQATLNDQRARMREKILADIQVFVTAKAKTAGYAIVIDTAAETVNATPAVVYSSSDVDLTDAVLKQLNAGAPIDTTPAPAVASPAPSLLNTNGP
jgi:Skp family chaperone for outer membrane proteins